MQAKKVTLGEKLCKISQKFIERNRRPFDSNMCSIVNLQMFYPMNDLVDFDSSDHRTNSVQGQYQMLKVW